jgi:hypothetical protein
MDAPGPKNVQGGSKRSVPPTQADYLKGALERQLDTFRRSNYDWADFKAAELITKFLEKEIETL